MAVVAPGFSITELAQALYKCKDIYRAFRSDNDSASVRLAAFGDEHYPGLEAFNNNLKACLKYLNENLRIYDTDYLHNPSGAIRTLLTAFDDGIPKFRERLSYDRIEFCSFKLRIVLEHSFRRSEQPVATPDRNVTQKQAPLAGPSAQGIALQQPDSSNELVLILNQYKRRVNSQADDPESMELLNNRFWACYSRICQQSGLHNDYQLLVIPLDDLHKYLDSARQTQTHSHRNTTRTWRSGTDFEVLLSRACQVEITIGASDPISADGYLMLGQTCRFIGSQKQTVFEHHVPQRTSCFSQFDIAGKPLTLGFLARQQVTGHPNGTQPEYKFQDETAYKQFQSDIEHKILILESRLLSIKSKHSNSACDAIKIYAKLWTSHDSSAEPWLNFRAMFQRRPKMWMVPLRWFNDLALPAHDTSKTITIRLARPPDSPAPPGRRRASLARIGIALPSHSRRPSTTSIQSDTDGLASFTGSQTEATYAPKNWLDRVDYLQFTFESSQGRIEFVETFRQLRQVLSPNAPGSSSTAASSTVGSPDETILVGGSSIPSSSPQTPFTTPSRTPAMPGQSSPQTISRRPVGSRPGSAKPSPRSPPDQGTDGSHLHTLDIRTATSLIPLEAILDEKEIDDLNRTPE